MDIKSLLDTDDAPTPRRSSGPPTGTHARESFQDRGPNTSHGQGLEYGMQRDSRPPQLSSIQTLGHQDARYLQSPSYATTSSPKQSTQSTNRSIRRHPSPHQHNPSPSNPSQTGHYFVQENRSSGGTPTHPTRGPSTPMTHTPTASTPGSATAYSNWQRPTSSHSASTPTSAQYPTQNFLRESSQAYTPQNGSANHPLPVQHTSPQSVTPLGPPTLRPRPSMEVPISSPGSNSHRREFSGEIQAPQRVNDPPSSIFRSPSADKPPFSRNSNHDLNDRREREQSLSVSPKTKLANMPRHHQAVTGGGISGSHNDYKAIADTRPFRNSYEYEPNGQQANPPIARRSTSMGIDSMLNAAPSDDVRSNRLKRPREDDPQSHVLEATSHEGKPPLNRSPQKSLSVSTSSQASMRTSQNLKDSQGTVTSPQMQTHQTLLTSTTSHPQPKPAMRNAFDIDMSSPTAEIGLAPRPLGTEALSKVRDQQSSDLMSAPIVPSQPATKKPRLDSANGKPAFQAEGKRATSTNKSKNSVQSQRPKKPPRMPPPIFAQSVRGIVNTGGASRTHELIKSQGGHQKSGILSSNGQISNSVPTTIPQQSDKGPLGPWEPSILNQIPTDGLTKIVSDFLFLQVMQNQEISVAPSGGAAGKGAVLEIEAKIGRLIDNNTMDRLRIPVMTETVFNRNDPNYRTSFESSMTEMQHRALNAFLNKALIATQAPKPTPQNPNPPPNQRVRMGYRHTKETDTFYELSQSGLLALPSSLNIYPRSASKVKVRITHDQKTGKELAKIVKTRLADIDIYSPQNQVDWRISVNVEMDFQGDMRDLIEPDKRGSRGADRNKDRMSYKHQAYQIDLTQVTPADATASSHKEHELEIEVSAEEVRRQGTLLQNGEANQFMDLVSGFVDNVRTLAKQVPVDYVPPSASG